MAPLGPHATVDELYEELSFIEVCEMSLDPDADNFAQRLAELQADRRNCERRLEQMNRRSNLQPDRPNDSDSAASTSRKRPQDDDDRQTGLPMAKRPTPEPTIGVIEQARLRQEAAALQANNRRRAELTDQQLAYSLSQTNGNSPTDIHAHAGPSVQTTFGENGSLNRPRQDLRPSQALPSHTPGAQPALSRSPPVTQRVKYESSHRTPASSTSAPRPSEPAVVDLTLSDSDEAIQPSRELARRDNSSVSQPRQYVNPAHTTLQRAPVPGAYPAPYSTAYDAQGQRQPLSYNPYDPDTNARPSTHHSALADAHRHAMSHHPAYGHGRSQPMPRVSSMVRSGFQTVRSMGSDLSRLANLATGARSQPYPVEDDEENSEGTYYDSEGDVQIGRSFNYGSHRSHFDSYLGHEDLYNSRFDAFANYDPAKTREEINDLLKNIRPDEDMPAHLRVQTPPAMAIQLHKYQELGLTWLQNCETGTNKGGILADDMGLGKTIQMLSLIVTHRSENVECRTTLIVAPVALMRQWKQEIEQKVKPGRHRLSVFVHHGSSKKTRFSDLSHFDVVLTTFGSIAAEVKKLEVFRARQRFDVHAVPGPKERCVLIGDDAKWYRVILDEAQCIKNRNTKTARGAECIRAEYRFCMTGTPMMNNVEELYSLIRFLRIKPYNQWDSFRKDIVQPLKSSRASVKSQAMKKLQTVCKAIMLRRTKKSTFEGKPILVLPERIEEIVNPEFNEDEFAFYQALEQSTQLQVNRYVKSGTIGKKYTAILLLLLRLRQACCHPHLVRDFGVSAAADITPEQLLEFARELQPSAVARIKERGGVFECPICLDASLNPAIFLPCGHDACAECFAKITDPSNGIAAGNESGTAQAKCPNCRGAIDAKHITDFESFKRVHQQDLLTEEEMRELEGVDDEETESDDSSSDSDSDGAEDDEDIKDPTLGGFIADDDEAVEDAVDSEDDDDLDRPLKGESNHSKKAAKMKGKAKMEERSLKEEEADVSEPEDRPTGRSKVDTEAEDGDEIKLDEGNAKPKKKIGKKAKSKKAKGKEKKKEKKQQKAMTLGELKKRAGRSVSDKKRYLRRLREDWVSSAKIDKTLEILKGIMDDAQGEKVLIFSQWTSFLDLLEVPIDENNWGYRRYDGSMNARQRSDAIDDFRDANKDLRIMLVSLKAGNAGLNLNMASQVIILDPFWNPFIEEQAIDRAHRLGQTRPVKVHRVLVQNTVEDRICKLQQDKRELISQALDEKASQSISRLGVQELMYLFGVSGSSRPPAQQPATAAPRAGPASASVY